MQIDSSAELPKLRLVATVDSVKLGEVLVVDFHVRLLIQLSIAAS